MSDPNSVFVTRFPPGHYYSPLPDMGEVLSRREEHFDSLPEEIPGVDLRTENQKSLFQRFTEEFLPRLPPYQANAIENYRYYHENDFYSRKDAVVLFCMLHHVRPKRLIEVGSGHSSALILDTNEHQFERSVELTFIDPEPKRLQSLLKPEDQKNATIIPGCVQDVDVDTFRQLKGGDILFIDSSHITKIGSDLNHLLFKVIPLLDSGVFVHFHDIFYPFEYPEHWIKQGRAWNEVYLIRAFLQYNSGFEMLVFSNYLLKVFPELFEHPLWAAIPPGGSCTSLWLRKK